MKLFERKYEYVVEQDLNWNFLFNLRWFLSGGGIPYKRIGDVRRIKKN